MNFELIQVVDKTEFEGWRCQVSSSLSVLFCGFDSYTQTVPAGHHNRPERIAAADCARLVETQEYIPSNGKPQKIVAPGLTSFKVLEAGSEDTSRGVMHCQGENYHIDGVMWREVLAEREYNVQVTKESFIHKNDILESVTSGVTIECLLREGGCAGSTSTFVWHLPAKSCLFESIQLFRGFWRIPNSLIESTTILGSFNVSAGQMTLPASCGSVTGWRTQHKRLVIREGDLHVKLPRLGGDLDVEIQVGVLLDVVARLQYKIADQGQQGLARADCEREIAGTDRRLRPTRRAGTFIMQAGQAVIEIQCRQVKV